MADVINLNKTRKARQRQEAKAEAARNRLQFGQSKPSRDKARKEAGRLQQDLDGKKLD